MEQCVSSLAYKGSISGAIAEAKIQRKLLIVYVSGDDGVSTEMERSTWADLKVAESVSNYCILLHLAHGTDDAAHFSALFPQRSVPSITAVGYNGVRLCQNEGFITAHDLASTLEKLWLSLHIQDSTAAVLSAALASKTSEPSSSEAGTSNVYAQSPSSADKHGEPSDAPMTVSSEKEKSDACIVEDVDASKFGYSKVFKAEKVDPDNPIADLASRATPINLGSHSPEQTSNSALIGSDEGGSKSQTVEKKERDSEADRVDDKRIAVLTDVHLNIRLPDGNNLQEKFSLTSTLQVVKEYVDRCQESVISPYDLAIPYPRKLYNDQDLGRTLSELGLQDRQALIVVPRQRGGTNQSHSRAVAVDPTNESSTDYSYFSYVKRLLSFIYPLSYLGGGSGQQSQSRTWEQGSSSTPQSGIAQGQRLYSSPSPSTARPRHAGFGSNIHTLKHDEDDEPFKDNNSYWNGNSTQYGGNDNNGK